MAIPDYETLMLPVLKAFDSGAKNVAELLPGIKQEFAISEDEAEKLIPSGRVTVLANRTHWARTYLSKAGLLESPKRNLHIITPKGRALLSTNPERIDNSVLASFDGFEAWRARPTRRTTQPQADQPPSVEAVKTAKVPQQTPDEVIAEAAAALDAELADTLLQEVTALSPTRFERLIIDLLRAMGYGGGADDMYRETAQSGDGGIDGVIDEDALGLDAVYIQAKRYAPDNRVGREALQAFVGSLTGVGASKGVFVTTSDFSAPARAYVDRVQQRIVLINGDRLARLMIAHEVGVRARRTYVVRSVDEDYFPDPG